MSRSKIAIGAVVAVAVLAVVGVFAFFTFRDSGPAELTLGERAETTESDSAVTTTSAVAVETVEAEITGAPVSAVEGRWTVAAESVAGYRVVEDFAGGISDFEAVGRTSDVTGELTIEETLITSAEFTVQVETIVSDDSRRDRQFSQSIMRSGDFPEATFVLTEPIDLGTIPTEGESITAQASGELTLRDATVPVSFPIEARLAGGFIETLGSVPVLFADYGISNPSFSLVSVRDEGVVEFSLIFEQP